MHGGQSTGLVLHGMLHTFSWFFFHWALSASRERSRWLREVVTAACFCWRIGGGHYQFTSDPCSLSSTG